MFDADRPITKSSQDRLNRTIFSKYLARCLLDHNDPESLVVGLYGGWGVGKTSIINLVREELEYASNNMFDHEKPIILNFSAWSYSGQNQLIYNFFRRLSSTLRNAPYLENSERIIHLLELYVSFFTNQPVPESLRPQKKWWQVFNRHSNHDDIYAWESGRDLTNVKQELNELLRHQHHKIIILIDNISRLYDYEIKQIFQIVKSIGDFSNTAYLLAFDKEQVLHELNEMDNGSGEQLLEKIIQLPFEIPPIQSQDLEKIFADRINQVVKTIPEGAWNTEYWADIFYTALKYFFENCRDITRYVNTLNFSYARLRDVVNPVDFFALTAIEVFMPQVYEGIRDNKDLFTDLLDNVYVLNRDQIEKDRERCDEILGRTYRLPAYVLLELLMHLFPRLRRIYTPDEPFYHSDAIARKLKRICSPDLFDVYFRLSMQIGKIPSSEFETILSFANDAKAFDQALTRLNQDERIETFLDLLAGDVLNTIPQEHIQAIVSALIDNGDLFPMGTGGLLSLDTPMRIHRIIHGLLKRLLTSEERFEILQKAIAKADKSIYISVHELREQAREHQEEADTYLPIEFRDLTPEELDLLCKLTVERIKYWAVNGSLADHPQILAILHAWLDWGNEEDVRHYVSELTATDRGLLRFLTVILDKPITEAMTKYQKNIAWQHYFSEIELFIPARLLEEHAKQLFEDEYFEKLTEREQLALMIFLDLLKVPNTKRIPKTS